jgi:hypothetical protein
MYVYISCLFKRNRIHMSLTTDGLGTKYENILRVIRTEYFFT